MRIGRRQLNKAATQKKLLSAARDIISEGGTISIVEVAKRAGVSTATGYRYYSDPDQLQSDAALELEMDETSDYLEKFLGRVEQICDPIERLLVAQRQMMGMVMRNQVDYRHFVAQSHMKLARSTPEKPLVAPGGRRITMIEAALQPAQARISKEAWSGLVRALMLVTGPEPFFVLRDFAGLPDDEIYAVTENTIRDIAGLHLERAGFYVGG